MAAELQDDEPLDPKVEAIRQKMMRLLMVSGGIMLVGFMALMITIVYKINQSSDRATYASATEGSISLPAGAQIIDTDLAGETMVLTLKLADGTNALHVFTVDGKPISRLKITNE